METDTGTVLHKLAAELGLSRDTMEARLKLQKTVYLLQTCGLHLGYGFSWYRYGPYSQELVYDAYRSLHAEKDRYAQKAKSLQLSPDTKTWLMKFKAILGPALRDEKQLELLASASFVRRAWHPEVTGFARTFKQHKARFFDGTSISNHDIEAAWQKLDELEAALPKR